MGGRAHATLSVLQLSCIIPPGVIGNVMDGTPEPASMLREAGLRPTSARQASCPPSSPPVDRFPIVSWWTFTRAGPRDDLPLPQEPQEGPARAQRAGHRRNPSLCPQPGAASAAVPAAILISSA